MQKKKDENSLEYFIYFNILNIEYLKIIKCYKSILKTFQKSKKEIKKNSDQSSIIRNHWMK